jgi:GMP synthase-like glutamine amidotransferase
MNGIRKLPMKPVLIVQQVLLDTPDYFVDFLTEKGIPYDLRQMESGDALPDSIKAYSGYCMLGGPMSVNDEIHFPFLRTEKALAREAVANDIPVIGHCLGGQLMSVAFGGKVSAASYPEIGWNPIRILNPASASKWFGGKMQVELFQWHNESFSIPDNATQIASSHYCENQAFVINDIHLAMQFHCEVNRSKVLHWAMHEKMDIDAVLHLPTVQSSETIINTIDERIKASQQLARAIYSRWILALKH